MLKNIFGRCWAAWGLLTFALTFLIIFLPSMASYLYKDEKKGQRYFILVSRVWMRSWLFLVGCPVRVKGWENFAPDENYVVVFNHNALLDAPLSAPFVPGANKTIAKASFAKVPLFGLFYKKGSVLVDRKKDNSRKKSFDAMKKVLAMGIHMCIYPEGTRNRTAEPLKPFYDGAFKLAQSTGKDIIPCVIEGTKEAMPIHKTFYLWPTSLSMEFLKPVSGKNKHVDDFKHEVYSLMREKFINRKNNGNG